jgi:DNA-binding NtrC family response regulator
MKYSGKEVAMKNPTILIAEGDESLRRNLRRSLSPRGFDLTEASGIKSVFRYLKNREPDLVIIGSSQKRISEGINETKNIRRQNKSVPIILITRYSSEEKAIAALRAGANDYFIEPFSCEELVTSIQRNISSFYQLPETRQKTAVTFQYHSQPMLGGSKSMRQARAHLAKVAATDSTVLITGETGTGKDLAAELIHHNSTRRKKPFVCVNCAAMPESLVESELFGYERGAFTGAMATKPGKFELANSGTIFLDEVADMTPYAQAKILRTIECKEVYPLGGKGAIPLDLRVIAATNQDPENLMSEGKFREDLYYRLNVARVHMPPLREKKEDIPRLIVHAIDKFNCRFRRNIQGLTAQATTTLFRYHWPGNVRELMNLIEASFINLPNKKVTVMDLPKQLQKRLDNSAKLPLNERKHIVSALLETKWNKSKVAQKLNWSRMTVYRKMTKYHIVEKRNRSQ